MRELWICKSCLLGVPDQVDAKNVESGKLLQEVENALNGSDGQTWKVKQTGCLDLCPEDAVGFIAKELSQSGNVIREIESTSSIKDLKEFATNCLRTL